MLPPQVFDRSSVDGTGLIRWNCQVAFLDEFRVVVALWNDFPFPPGLSVFNTLLPQDHPRHMRQFKLPPKHGQRSARVHLDRDRSLGTVDRDGPLIVDPTQAILVMDLSPSVRQPQTLIILRMHPLIEHTCSMRPEVQIPWDEWGRDAVVMEIPIDFTYSTITIHGARVLAIHQTRRDPEDCHRIHVFDFSRRATSALPPLGDKVGGSERRVAFKGGRNCALEGGEGMSAWGLRSLGDSVVFYKVSIPPHSS